MKIFESKYCTVEFLEDDGIVAQHWQGFAGSVDFREAIRVTLDFFEKTDSARSLISDTLNQKPVDPSDTDWVAQEINPKLVQAGMKKMVFVMPQSVITKIGVQGFSEENKAPFDLNFVTSYEEALAWVRG